MATYYWVNGSGNWTNGTGHFSQSSGGSASGFPTSDDDLIFDANSGSGTVYITLTQYIQCATLTVVSGVDSKFVFLGNGLLNIFGSLIVQSIITASNCYSYIHLKASSAGYIIDTAATDLGALFILQDSGGYTLASNFYLSNSFYLYGGLFDTANYDMRVSNFGLSMYNGGTVTLGSSTITVSDLYISNPNEPMTVNVGTSTFVVSTSIGGDTYPTLHNVILDPINTAVSINAAFVCDNLTLWPTSSQTPLATVTFSNDVRAASTLTVNNGVTDPTYRWTMTASTPVSIIASEVNLTNVDFQNIHAGTSRWTGTNLIDLGGNSNIAFPSTASPNFFAFF